jgi:hypothetical protein
MGNSMMRVVGATSLLAALASMGCGHKPYVSNFPSTATGKCSTTSFVWACNDRPRQRAVQAQQGVVAAESGKSDAAPPKSK